MSLYKRAITFEELEAINKKRKKRPPEDRKIKTALLQCPHCKKRWWKNKAHGESVYADFYYFNCPDCGKDYSALWPKSKQHRRGKKLKMKFT